MNQRTQFQAIAIGVVEAAVLLAVLAVPVFINFYSFGIFELDKTGIFVALMTLAALGLLVYLVDGAWGGRAAFVSWLRQPLVAAATVLGLVTAASAAVSIYPRASIWGSHERGQGLITLVAELVLFGAVAYLTRDRARARRLVGGLIVGTVPVSLFAITQVLGLQVVPGEAQSAGRAFGFLSNPIFLGAYLMLLFPLTAARALAAIRDRRAAAFSGFVLIAALQLVGLVASGSRGPQLGLVVGLGVFVLAAAIVRRRANLVVGMLGLGLAGLLFLVIFNLPNSPLAPLRQVPVIGRFGQIFQARELDRPTDATSQGVRAAIWRSANRLLAAEPGRLALGHGPETLKLAILPYGEANLGGREQAGFLVDRAHNVLLDYLVMLGIPGALALLALYVAWLMAAVRGVGLAQTAAARKQLLLFLVVGSLLGALVWVVGPIQIYGAAATLLGMVGGLVAYLLMAFLQGRRPETVPSWTALGLLATGAAVVAEAAFGIQTIVTQVVWFSLAGLLVGRTWAGQADGDDSVAEAVLGGGGAGEGRSRSAAGSGSSESGSVAAPSASMSRRTRSGSRGGSSKADDTAITLNLKPSFSALGLLGGATLGLIVYGLVLYGTPALPYTLPVVGLLIAGGWLAGLVWAVDSGEGPGSWGFTALLSLALYVVFRQVVLVVSTNAAVLFALTVLWLLVIAMLAGVMLRPKAGPAAISDTRTAIVAPLAAIAGMTLVFLAAIQPVQADIFFQSALANFDAALTPVDPKDEQAVASAQALATQRLEVAETLYGLATRTNPGEDLYPLNFAERYTALGAAAGSDMQGAAKAFGRAQDLVVAAEALNPRQLYHVYNRGHIQVVFAQMLPPGSERANVAKNAEDALTPIFEPLSYDPQVVTELGLARFLEGKTQEAISTLDYVLKIDPGNATAHGILGRALLDDGQTDRAAQEMALGLKQLQEQKQAGLKLPGLDQQIVQTMVVLGDLARKKNDLDAAAGYYNGALTLGLQSWETAFNLGLVLRDKKDYEGAFVVLSKVIQAAPPEDQDRVQEVLDEVMRLRGAGSPGAPTLPGGATLPGSSSLPGTTLPGTSGLP